MSHDPNKNAKVIIPLAIAAWAGGIVAFKLGLPAVVGAVFIVAFAVAVPVTVFYLIGEAGWRVLVKRHRAREPYRGAWQPCATGQMAMVSVDHPDFNRVKMRFVGGSLRVAATGDALHLATGLSKVPLLGLFFPALTIPWAAIAKARVFEAPGWFAPLTEPGSLLQVAYDPNYTGKFVELEVDDPAVYIQLPAAIIGDGLERIRFTTPGNDGAAPYGPAG